MIRILGDGKTTAAITITWITEISPGNSKMAIASFVIKPDSVTSLSLDSPLVIKPHFEFKDEGGVITLIADCK